MSANVKQRFIPAEWAVQKAVWLCWPSDPELWPQGLLEKARGEVTGLVRAISDGTRVKVLASGVGAFESAKAKVSDVAEVFEAKFGDIWLRDTGPIFDGAGHALRFRTNGWGGKYIYEGDDQVGDLVAQESGAPILRNDFILEGGAVEHNGAGVVLTTRQCVLNSNRMGWSEAEAGAALKVAFGAHRICWLDEGLLNDHTDGHIDNAARFVAENHVVCQQGFGEDDPNAVLYERMATDLRAMGFKVTQIPSPGLFKDALTGEISPASHMNFIITNKVVVVPTYGAASTHEALKMLQNLFPHHKVIGLPATAILTGGGSFHCITQQEPDV
ncbi:MAG: agmatine deiminase family protein [Micavibrio sp.]|nr:agmatine deiminase family protein [Micavibrio sp.]